MREFLLSSCGFFLLALFLSSSCGSFIMILAIKFGFRKYSCTSILDLEHLNLCRLSGTAFTSVLDKHLGDVVEGHVLGGLAGHRVRVPWVPCTLPWGVRCTTVHWRVQCTDLRRVQRGAE